MFLYINYTIVESKEWSIAFFTRAETSQKGAKTLLWIRIYITKNIVIHYKGFELSHKRNTESHKKDKKVNKSSILTYIYLDCVPRLI